MLHIVGDCDKRIFGLSPAERIRRQLSRRGNRFVVAHASAVLNDAAFDWMLEHPDTVIASRSGQPLAVATDEGNAARAENALRNGASDFLVVVPERDQFVRQLRRRVALGAYSLLEDSTPAIERRLFADVYKGVTDLVTKWAWPWPAYQVTRSAARLGVPPNLITVVGILLVFLAGFLFYEGQIASGLAAAWMMTFLDTVDGKLARVTITSSPFGNLLDHGTDIIHPPVWWYCLAHGIAAGTAVGGQSIYTAFWIILASYVLGRLIELAFKRRFGINQYIWRRFDSRFRLIVSRRNTILLLMTIGVALGAPAEAFWVCAGWSVISTAIQLLRLLQAAGESRRSRIVSWLT